MGSANVEAAQSIYARWARGDYDSTDWAAPDIEYVRPDGPETGTWTRETIATGWGEFLSAWQEYRMEAQEFRELDDQRVLVLVNHSGRGKSSGLDVRQVHAEGATVFHFQDGKVIRLAFYFNAANALADTAA